MAEAVTVKKAQYFKVPKPAERRATKYRTMRDDGVSKSSYETSTKEEVIGGLLDTAFADLEALDKAVGDILTRHNIFKNPRIPYLNYARQLYAFGRRYGKIPPDYVKALRMEKEFAGATNVEVLKEIEDAVALILGIGPISPEEGTTRRTRGRARGAGGGEGGGAAGGGGEEQISLSP
jgi:hypothetical protein